MKPVPARPERGLPSLAQLDIAMLRLIDAVVQAGTISAGAAASHLSVAAASKRISDLESRLGYRLFERHTRGVVPTSAGVRVLEYAREVLALTAALEGELDDDWQGIADTVRLVANAAAIVQFLPRDLSAFLRERPHIRVELSEQSSREVVESLMTDRADLGIFESSFAMPGLDRAPYRTDALVLIVPPAHPLARRRSLAFADALDYEVVSLRPETAIQNQLARAAVSLGRRLRTRVRVHSFDAVCRMVEAGAGVGVVPRLAADNSVRSRRVHLIPLSDPWARRELSIGWSAHRPLSAGARILLERLRSEVSLGSEAPLSSA